MRRRGWAALLLVLLLAPAPGWGEADGIREVRAAPAVVEPGPEAASPLQAAAGQEKGEEQDTDNQEGQEGAEE